MKNRILISDRVYVPLIFNSLPQLRINLCTMICSLRYTDKEYTEYIYIRYTEFVIQINELRIYSEVNSLVPRTSL